MNNQSSRPTRFEPAHGIIAVKGTTLPAAPWEKGKALSDLRKNEHKRDHEAERAAAQRRRVRVAELCMAGIKGAEICAELNIPRTTLDYDLQKLGLRLRTQTRRNPVHAAKIKDRRDQVQALCEAGMSAMQIAERLQIKPHIARADMHALNLSPHETRRDVRRDRLRQIYRDDMTIAQVAEALGCSVYAARDDLRALGLRKQPIKGGEV